MMHLCCCRLDQGRLALGCLGDLVCCLRLDLVQCLAGCSGCFGIWLERLLSGFVLGPPQFRQRKADGGILGP
jgi:hypothetical protein